MARRAPPRPPPTTMNFWEFSVMGSDPLRSRDGEELGKQMHLEAAVRVVAPPAGKAGERGVPAVPRVHETAPHSPRAGVEVFVGAPDGEVHVPVVERQRNIADGVRQVQTD